MGTADRALQHERLKDLLASVGAKPYSDPREDVLRVIRENPGVSFIDLCRKANVSDKRVRAITRDLEEEGAIVIGKVSAGTGRRMVFVAVDTPKLHTNYEGKYKVKE